MNLTEHELREIAKDKLDIEELIDLLRITNHDIVEQFSHRLVQYSDDVQDYISPEDYIDG